MLYPKEDKENRILLYAVSAGSPLASGFAPSPRAPCWLPTLSPLDYPSTHPLFHLVHPPP